MNGYSITILNDRLLIHFCNDGPPALAQIAKVAYQDSPDTHPILAQDQTLSHLLSHQRNDKVSHRDNFWDFV